MKLIIAGTRDFTDYELLKKEVSKVINGIHDVEIVSGGATGADTLAIKYAKENNLPLKLFPAEWTRHGKAAGPIRNEQMAKYADSLIVFWDGKSKGTKNMLKVARENKVFGTVIMYTDRKDLHYS